MSTTTGTLSKRRTRTAAQPRRSDPVEAAAAASLRYVSDDRPGITRKRSGKGFSYRNPDGSLVTDRATLERIRMIVIPPAWTDVWISPIANGHVQATGRDARGRKQHRYHERWRAVRDEDKFARLTAFARALPAIRERVAADMALPGFPPQRVVALVVHLLETTYVRIGNEEYARTNQSYGLTTLTNRHVTVQGATIRFQFNGKSHQPHRIELTDRKLAALVRRMRELPGQDLFQYLGDDGTPHPIDSSNVNAYLKEISGGDFTAKDFRTWGGTLLAVRQLAGVDIETELSAAQVKSLTVSAVKAVAEQLRNTPAVCRKCYIHPQVLSAWSTPNAIRRWRAEVERERLIEGLDAEESALVRFLEAVVP